MHMQTGLTGLRHSMINPIGTANFTPEDILTRRGISGTCHPG